MKKTKKTYDFTNGKSIYVSLAGLVLLILVMIPIINKSANISEHITRELESLEVQKEIWMDIETLFDEWNNNEITREELADEGHKLVLKFKKIEGDTYDNSNEVLSDSNSIKLETKVMLFDIVRGFDIDGNEYADKEPIEEEVLKYVHPKRAKTFFNLYDNFKEKYWK